MRNKSNPNIVARDEAGFIRYLPQQVSIRNIPKAVWSICWSLLLVASPVYAEDVVTIENKLFTDNIEKLLKAVRAGVDIHVEPARADPNSNKRKQLRYCNRLVKQMRSTRPASDFMPKPVYSTATDGNEFIQKFFLQRVSRCTRNKANDDKYGQYGYAYLFDLKQGMPYFRIYENPQHLGNHVLMRIWVAKPRRDVPNPPLVDELVGSLDPLKNSTESCFYISDAESGGLYPGGPSNGVFLFDGQIMTYTLGTTVRPCPEDAPCPDHNDFGNSTYFLRLFPPNVGAEIFGARFLKALEKDEVEHVTWNPNYICTIYFD